MERIELDIAGRKVKVWAERLRGDLWFHWEGRTYCVEGHKSRIQGKASSGLVHPGLVVAPMPGKITKVAVSVGQQVGLNQALIVMEAMKMEYTLAAQVAGQVTALHVQTGDQVALNKVLVQIEGDGSRGKKN